MWKSISSKWLAGTDEKPIPVNEQDAECIEEWGVSLADETILVEQLRDETSLEIKIPADYDFHALRRFLRARKHDILKAKQMIIATITWRTEVGAYTIIDDFDFHEAELFFKYYPENFYGVCRQGQPVYIQRPGGIDCTKLWEFTTLDRSIKHHIQRQESYVNQILPAASIASGKIQEQSIVIIDMEGVTVSTLTGEVTSIMRTIMKIDQDHYPELMDKCLIINAPTTFRIIFSMVQVFLDTRTQKKIVLLPRDYREELLKYISPENLEERYGGTCKKTLWEGEGPWLDAEVMEQVEMKRREIFSSIKQVIDATPAPAADCC